MSSYTKKQKAVTMFVEGDMFRKLAKITGTKTFLKWCEENGLRAGTQEQRIARYVEKEMELNSHNNR